MIISYGHGNLGNGVPNILIEGMSYVDILNHIKSTVYCPKKGMLTMICDVVICTHYLLLEQIDTGIR